MSLPDTVDRNKVLDLLEHLGSHSLYRPEPLLSHLAECGLIATLLPNGAGLAVLGKDIELRQPEYGSPGISPFDLLDQIYRASSGNPPDYSGYTGRGFVFRSVLDQLAMHWGINKSYL